MTSVIEKAAAVLRRGGLVAFPTETVYGLGADAACSSAVEKVFAAKGRPAGHPLIVHLASASMVDAWARLDPEQERAVGRLADAFWPGPLTIVVPRSDLVAAETVGGRDTVGLRVPDHPVALEVLRAFGGGVAAPSANRFGRVSPTTAEHVRHDLGELVEVIVDGGPTTVGVESTIVELTGSRPTLLRPGAVTAPELSDVLGLEVVDDRQGQSRAPGMLQSHYAPAARVAIVSADEVERTLGGATDGRAGRPFTGVIAPFDVDHAPSWRLPAGADGYARELYASLRAADRAGVELLLIVPPAEGALSAAVNDRLTKAAAPEREPQLG